MKRLKKYLGSVALSFLLIGAAGTALLLPNAEKGGKALSAAVNEIENAGLPDFWNDPKLNHENSHITQLDNVFLYDGSTSSFTLSILGDDDKYKLQYPKAESGSGENTFHYALKVMQPDGTYSEKEYTFFDFSNTTSLYYNITKEDLSTGESHENLLSGFSTKFAIVGTEEKVPVDVPATPQRFQIDFKLNTENTEITGPDTTTPDTTVTLFKEGLYTLAINVDTFHTTNGGVSFNPGHQVIYYSFYVFNSSTYFNVQNNNTPNVRFDNTLYKSNVLNANYSLYHYYNYSSNKLPTISYDKNKFQLSINYSNTDDRPTTATIIADENEVKVVGNDGNELPEGKVVKFAELDGNGNVVLHFNELGTYDFSFKFLYTDANGRQFYLPLEGQNGSNGSDFRSNKQRLYIYGYQVFHTEYGKQDEDTFASESSEFKSFDANHEIIKNADITAKIDIIGHGPQATKPSQSLTIENLEKIINATDSETEERLLTPVKTNQPPVKFKSLTTNVSGKIYQVTEDVNENKLILTDLTEEQGSFNTFNQNIAGTYLYLLEYTFASLLDEGGNGNSTAYSWQVLYFTIEDVTPSVEIKDGNGNVVPARGFTNKSVTIVDTSSTSPFDAKVEITISAKNFSGNFIGAYNNFDIDNLPANGDIYLTNESGKRTVFISNQDQFANASFELKIRTKTSSSMEGGFEISPNIITFTIDTTEIGDVMARNVQPTSSSKYTITTSVQSITNQPMIFSWNKKQSGAETFGYYKYFPITNLNYYLLDSSALIEQVLNENMVPANAKLDLSKNAEWEQYFNTLESPYSIDAGSVRSAAGLYIFMVYDKAGNTSYQTFILDNTSPLFVQCAENSGGNKMYEILSTSSSLSVTTDFEYTIFWSKNKSIYLNFETSLQEFISSITHHNGNGVKFDTDENEKLQDKLTAYFTGENFKYISSINQSPENNEISSYSTYYLFIPIEKVAYIKGTKENSFNALEVYSYKINLFNDEANTDPAEGDHQILIRDAANSKYRGENEEDKAFKNAPSAYLTINVTSDTSKTRVMFGETDLTRSGFTLSGKFYEKDGELSYNESEGAVESEKNYRFTYYTPVKTQESTFTLHFTPVKGNLKVESINMKYYPFERKEETQDIGANKEDQASVFYYKLKDSPDFDQKIFTYKAGQSYKDDEVIEITTTGRFTQPGKYVFTRKYADDSNTDPYDFFERTLTLIVDPYNVISEQEQIKNTLEGKENISVESVVGGDIILSMYSGQGNSLIEVSYPNYNKDTGLNQGTLKKAPTFSVETNKLPLSILVPKYKYTTYYQHNENNGYSVYDYNALKQFGNASLEEKTENGKKVYVVIIDGVERRFDDKTEALNLIGQTTIEEYLLEARVEFIGANDERAYYASCEDEEGGYLKLFEVSSPAAKVTDKTKPVSFTKPGTYNVTISQANNQVSTGDLSFTNSYTFSFKIENNAPQFDVISTSGIKLQNSTTDENGIEEFFTNSNSIAFKYTDSSSDFIANIDPEAISAKLRTKAGEEVASLEPSGDDKTHILAYEFPDGSQKGDCIEVTMQFYGHKEGLYKTTTKRVYLDYTAPTENLGQLMTKVQNATNYLSRAYLERNARTFTNANGEEISSAGWTENKLEAELEKVSYSYTQTAQGYTFANYNYSADLEFFKTLQASLTKADKFGVNQIYFKEIKDLSSYTQTTKDNFNSVTATEGRMPVDFETEFENYIEIGKYYEIIERDRAGNMVVYIVKISDPNASALEFENNLKNDNLNSSAVTNGANIYSAGGFKLKKLDFNGDDWGVYRLSINGVPEIYMTSPNLAANQIYRLKSVGGNYVFEIAEIKEVINVDASSVKHSIGFANRLSGQNITLYLSIMNESLSAEKGETEGVPYISLNVPTSNEISSTTEATVFPVEISVAQLADKSWQNLKTFKNLSGAPENWLTLSGEGYTFEYVGGKLYLKVNIGGDRRQLRYQITDNYGKTITLIQIPNEEKCQEISGLQIYEIANSDGSVTNLSKNPITFEYNSQIHSAQISEMDENGKFGPSSVKPYKKQNTQSIFTATFGSKSTFDSVYKIVIRDLITDTVVKTFYIRIVNTLPQFEESLDENSAIVFYDRNHNVIKKDKTSVSNNMQVEFEGNVYTDNATVVTTYSNNVTLAFTNGQFDNDGKEAYETKLSYSLYISKDGNSWLPLNSYSNGYRISGAGEYTILAKYDHAEWLKNECRIFLLKILDSSSVFYDISVDGHKVNKSDISFTIPEGYVNAGKGYDTNYLISVNYLKEKDTRFKLSVNDELGVKAQVEQTIYLDSDVVVEIYHFTSNGSAEGKFTVIYIPQSQSFVKELYYSDSTGASTNLPTSSQTTSTILSKIKLSWTSHYGIDENTIKVKVSKLYNGDYVKVDIPVSYDRESDTNYISLTRAGSYQIKFVDSCPDGLKNTHLFGNNPYLSINLLNAVPFIVNYTDPISGEEKMTEPINHAIYNGEVKLSLVELNTYLYPKISVTRNGQAYEVNATNYVYTFTQTGYYKVKFSAQDRLSGNAIKEEEFVFTILNPKESMLSYEVTPYQNYYIEKIEKFNENIEDRVDITENLLAKLGSNKVNVNGKLFFNQLLFSLSDEKTGFGRYVITVNTGDNSYNQITEQKFTFMFWINNAIPPISVSVKDGGSSTSPIQILFDAQDVLDRIGECYIRIGSSRFDITEETVSEFGAGLQITQSGTYFIQVFTQSGVLLYSYKVTKGTPLNAWAIIAIVLGVVGVVVIIVITVKLRKKPRVK